MYSPNLSSFSPYTPHDLNIFDQGAFCLKKTVAFSDPKHFHNSKNRIKLSWIHKESTKNNKNFSDFFAIIMLQQRDHTGFWCRCIVLTLSVQLVFRGNIAHYRLDICIYHFHIMQRRLILYVNSNSLSRNQYIKKCTNWPRQ